MIDFDVLVNGPVQQTFGQACQYTPKGSTTAIAITATFFNGYLAITDGSAPPPQSSRPMLGVQLSQLPLGFDAESTQDDLVTVIGVGSFVVKSGKPDGLGWAQLELQVAP